MNANDRKEFSEVSLITKQNAEAIRSLVKTVDKLGQVVAKEDGRILDTIAELKEANALCRQRHETFVLMFKEKKERLTKVETDLYSKINSKASKEDLALLSKRLWGIGTTGFGILLTMLGYLIKLQIERGG